MYEWDDANRLAVRTTRFSERSAVLLFNIDHNIAKIQPFGWVHFDIEPYFQFDIRPVVLNLKFLLGRTANSPFRTFSSTAVPSSSAGNALYVL